MTIAVLVVDDEPLLREIVTRFLEEEGFSVRGAGDGRAALAEHDRSPADIIVSDVMMPRLDGIGLVRALRERGDATAVVLISAGSPRVDGLSGTHWLRKPFDLDDLLACIAEAGHG